MASGNAGQVEGLAGVVFIPTQWLWKLRRVRLGQGQGAGCCRVGFKPEGALFAHLVLHLETPQCSWLGWGLC